jgi:hypothetical protein
MLVQDNCLHFVNDPPDSFKKTVQRRREWHTAQLNNAMMPLTGGDKGLHDFHQGVVSVALDLNAQFEAYTGEHEEIAPQIGSQFEDGLHECVGLPCNAASSVGKHILATLMIGVRYRLPGKEWVVCCKAKVQLVSSAYQ